MTPTQMQKLLAAIESSLVYGEAEIAKKLAHEGMVMLNREENPKVYNGGTPADSWNKISELAGWGGGYSLESV